MSKLWTRLERSALASPSTASVHPIPPVTQTFEPRASFEIPKSIPRSYYLGHHAAGVRAINTQLSSVGLILECRDIRVPLTSWNPHLEKAVAGPPRIVVYTKTDLVSDSGPRVLDALRKFHTSRPGESVAFVKKDRAKTGLLHAIRDAARLHDSIIGMRVFVVGMPNVGKSTLLNALRKEGLGGGRAKAAITGNHPGITRKLSMPVRILGGKDQPPDSALGEGVFVIDTPGVFMPYVSRAEDMLKLSLVHGIKDNLVPHEIVADYLLYRLNLQDPSIYAKYSPPTNDVAEFLESIARKTGKIGRSRLGFEQQAAAWIIEQWRSGNLGRFVLDDLSSEGIEARVAEARDGPISWNQAKRREKEVRKERAQEKRSAG